MLVLPESVGVPGVIETGSASPGAVVSHHPRRVRRGRVACETVEDRSMSDYGEMVRWEPATPRLRVDAGARLLGRRGGVRGHRGLDRSGSRPRTDGGGVRGRRPDRHPECGSAARPGGPPAAVHAGRRLSGRPRRGRLGPPGGRRRALGRRARGVIRRRAPRGPRDVGRESGDPGDHRCERRRRVHAQGHSAHREAAGRDRAHRRARHHLPRDRRAGAAGAARRDARWERAVHGEPDLRPRPPAGRVGEGSVISDRERARPASCSAPTRTFRPFAGSRRRPA